MQTNFVDFRQQKFDSVANSLKLGLFQINAKKAIKAHSQPIPQSLPLSLFREGKVKNFEAASIASDIKALEQVRCPNKDYWDSLKYCLKVNDAAFMMTRIWVYYDSEQGYILLDGNKRIIAAHLRHQTEIDIWKISPSSKKKCLLM